MVLVSCADDPIDVTTFNRDVAPILWEHCAGCHQPQGSAPFSLVTYDDAQKRARQIVQVTESRFMPPWLPEPGHGSFAGARRLTDDEIGVFGDWLNDGELEGQRADRREPPPPTEGWQLGQPDLVVQLPQPYELAAEGVDVYRNFVIRMPRGGVRWVEAVEFRPLNLRVTHHARLLIDRDGRSRQIDADDPLPGFAGMEIGGATTPDGSLIGWTPGRVPHPGHPGMAWRLDDTTDLVLQLHLVPTGRPESVDATVGLYFADEAPTLHPVAFVLGSRDIDIAAGDSQFVVEDDYELPVDVQLLAIYPHAHYLGKTMQLEASFPNGTSESLLRISDWDFNWQDEYHYADPVALPRGTTLSMRYTYDNTSSNPRNPHEPPRRVVYGSRTFDEMAELMVQVLPATLDDHRALQRHRTDNLMRKAIDYRLRRLERNADDVASLAALGSTYLSMDMPADAIDPLRRAVRLQPTDVRLQNNLGYALRQLGRDQEAVIHLEKAVGLSPDNAGMRFTLAETLLALDRVDEAIVHYERIVELRPDIASAREALARARARQGR